MLRRGEAPVLVRYEGAYAATTLTVMGDRTRLRLGAAADEQLHRRTGVQEAAARENRCRANLCTDEEFIRRVYLDLTGLPPSPTRCGRFWPIRARRASSATS